MRSNTRTPPTILLVPACQPLKQGQMSQTEARISAQTTTSRPQRWSLNRSLQVLQTGTSTRDHPNIKRNGRKNARSGFWALCAIFKVECGIQWHTMHLFGNAGTQFLGSVMLIGGRISNECSTEVREQLAVCQGSHGAVVFQAGWRVNARLASLAGGGQFGLLPTEIRKLALTPGFSQVLRRR